MPTAPIASKANELGSRTKLIGFAGYRSRWHLRPPSSLIQARRFLIINQQRSVFTTLLFFGPSGFVVGLARFSDVLIWRVGGMLHGFEGKGLY